MYQKFELFLFQVTQNLNLEFKRQRYTAIIPIVKLFHLVPKLVAVLLII